MKYVKQKLPGFKSGINYDDLESEITRLEKERRSAENEHKLVHERLASLLETNDWDKAEFEGVWRDSRKNRLQTDISDQIGRSLPDD